MKLSPHGYRNRLQDSGAFLAHHIGHQEWRNHVPSICEHHLARRFGVALPQTWADYLEIGHHVCTRASDRTPSWSGQYLDTT